MTRALTVGRRASGMDVASYPRLRDRARETLLRLPADADEETLTVAVIAYARERGWLVAHFRPALTAKGWRTVMQGDTGFPDLVLARGGVLLVELKKAGKLPRPDQRAWATALGAHYRLWTAADAEAITEDLW